MAHAILKSSVWTGCCGIVKPVDELGGWMGNLLTSGCLVIDVEEALANYCICSVLLSIFGAVAGLF